MTSAISALCELLVGGRPSPAQVVRAIGEVAESDPARIVVVPDHEDLRRVQIVRRPRHDEVDHLDVELSAAVSLDTLEAEFGPARSIPPAPDAMVEQVAFTFDRSDRPRTCEVFVQIVDGATERMQLRPDDRPI